MLTTRWSTPTMNLWNTLNREMNRVWNDLAAAQTAFRGLAAGYPPVNLWEDDDNLYVEAELPGLRLEDLNLLVNGGNLLTIEGERKPCEAQGVWHRRERGFGRFSKVVELPVPVDADKVEARFDSGVLRVTLPKAEHARPRRIAVKAE